MRILLLLIAVLVPSYLLMCQRQTGEDAGKPGEVVYQRQLQQARGMEQQLRDDLEQREREMQRQMEEASDR